MNSSLSCIALFAVCGLFSNASANAGVLFTNLASSIIDSDEAVNCCSGEFVQSDAGAFTSTVNYVMSQVQVEVTFQSGFDNIFNLSLYSDNAGAPGSKLDTLGTNLAAPGTFGAVSDSSFAPIVLMGGTQYWLVMTPATADTLVFWAGSGVPLAPSDAALNATASAPWISLFGSSDGSLQFEIDGNPAPEPSTAAIVGAALCALAFLPRRMRRRLRSH
jgi:hypothetical protein